MKTTFYVQVEPEHARYAPYRLRRIIARKLTQKRPEHPVGAVIKLTLDIPDRVFEPLADITVEIPEEHAEVTVQSEPVPVNKGGASEDGR